MRPKRKAPARNLTKLVPQTEVDDVKTPHWPHSVAHIMSIVSEPFKNYSKNLVWPGKLSAFARRLCHLQSTLRRSAHSLTARQEVG